MELFKKKEKSEKKGKKERRKEYEKEREREREREIAPWSQIFKHLEERNLSKEGDQFKTISIKHESFTCVCFIPWHEFILFLIPEHLSPVIRIRSGRTFNMTNLWLNNIYNIGIVAELAELFRFKCASHRYTADTNSTHFKRNNPLVCRVFA
jgi:hypothetical protein